MAQILIYSTPTCPYCIRAKALLAQKGAAYAVVDVAAEPALRAEMTQLAGGRTSVPQIFVNGRHVGGCDDLHALDAAGTLDALLAEPAPEPAP